MKETRFPPRVIDQGGNEVYIQMNPDGECWRYKASVSDLCTLIMDAAKALDRVQRWEASERRRRQIADMSPEPEC